MADLQVNGVEVRRAMHEGQFIAGRGARFGDGTALGGPPLRHAIEHLGALRPLGVARRRHVMTKPR